MSRTISTTARAALYGQETAQVFLNLLTISHADLPASILLADNSKDVTVGANTYLAFPFLLELPADQEGETPRATLTIDNVSQQLLAQVRTITTPFDISLSVVLASSPSTVEAGPFSFRPTDVAYDVQRMTFSLAYEQLLQEPFPATTYAPTNYPNLFRAVDR